MKLEGFRELKTELDGYMQEVLGTVDLMKSRIKDNVKSDANPEGLLLSKYEKYMQCLETKHEELEKVYRSDEANWIQHLENVKSSAATLQDDIAEFLSK